MGSGRTRRIFYCGLIHRRIRMQDSYKPEFEDWLFHVLLPLASYLTLVVSAIAVLFEYHKHAVRSRHFGARTALRRNSQCMGRGDVSCFCFVATRTIGTE
jgi:hypothetical protein